ncbi:MAG: SpoIIE family protein phosphatase [Acidobacteriota bacterium]
MQRHLRDRPEGKKHHDIDHERAQDAPETSHGTTIAKARFTDRPLADSGADCSEIAELGRGSLPLGVRPVLEIERESAVIQPGDLLLLYTDGLPEAQNRTGEVFGYERIARLLASGGSSTEAHDRVLAAFHGFVGEERLADDACVAVIGRDAWGGSAST